MIIKFGGSNFASFKEYFEIDLSSGKGINKEISKTFAIKGANASGKTSIFKAMAFLKHFALNSFRDYLPQQNIAIDSFFNNNDPIELYVNFTTGDNEYTYEVSLTKTKILHEKLYQKLARRNLIIHRENNSFKKVLPGHTAIKSIKLRDNASFISTAIQSEMDDSIKDIVSFFNSIITNVFYQGSIFNILDYKELSKFYNDNPASLKLAIYMLKAFDTGIEDIKIDDHTHDDGKIEYTPMFIFKINDETKILRYHTQSTGTKTLYSYAALFASAFKNKNILLFDEFDMSLHSDILPKLIQLFEENGQNIHGSQFIFSTHSADIIDEMNKTSLALVGKKDNESFIYRLDELPSHIVRSDRPISTPYKANKIGGRPNISRLNINEDKF